MFIMTKERDVSFVCGVGGGGGWTGLCAPPFIFFHIIIVFPHFA